MRFPNDSKLYNDSAVGRNQFYKLKDGQTISFVELQREFNDEDRVEVQFELLSDSKGFFVKESFNPKACSSRKRCDITVGYTDAAGKCEYFCLYDVKRTVKLDSTILKLCAQWNSGCDYIFDLLESEDEEKSGYVGVCTSVWNQANLESELFHLKRNFHLKYQKMDPSVNHIVFMKKMNEMLLAQNNIRLMENSINGVFSYVSRLGHRYEYSILKVTMDEREFGYGKVIVVGDKIGNTNMVPGKGSYTEGDNGNGKGIIKNV